MDLVAGVVAMYMLIAIGLWSLLAGFAGAFTYKKTNSLGVSALAGLTPLLLAWILLQTAKLWPEKPQITVINGKAYTPETLPAPTIGVPSPPVTDDPKNLDLLQLFGIDPPAIEICRKKGCRVEFNSNGGISSYGPLKPGNWQYILDPVTEK